jgi:cystathionine beta-lyase family protein involved in aluminum resistance
MDASSTHLFQKIFLAPKLVNYAQYGIKKSNNVFDNDICGVLEEKSYQFHIVHLQSHVVDQLRGQEDLLEVIQSIQRKPLESEIHILIDQNIIPVYDVHKIVSCHEQRILLIEHGVNSAKDSVICKK